tara:strand:- start:112 stop:330 length:219 start_codon:yes stop_codon:yes gene_type:complete
MSNMSYCRFQNTRLDLQDCIDAINGGEINDLSRDEQQAFIDLIMKCKEVAENFEDYNDYELGDFIKEQQEQF